MEEKPVLDTSLARKGEDYVRAHFNREVSPQFVYHNFEHTRRVAGVVAELADAAHVAPEEKEDLVLSALFHDTGYGVSTKDHETHSKEIAVGFLQRENVPQERIDRILRCIDATRLGHLPEDRLEMLMKDADTSNLGDDKFFELSEQLRQEINMVNHESLDKLAWTKINLQFLKDHKYFTPEAKARFNQSKKEHARKIEKKLKKENRRSLVDAGLITLGSNKSAQTQFKTSLRNHINLSSIADNKANIMLSVNALIITFTLPLLGERIAADQRMLVPTLILLTVCITAMVFATLATRPIPMKGRSSMEDIKSKKSNLFFFGNFYRMTFGEYESGMREIVKSEELLDNSIMRDLFFLGKALGKKYHYLRLCYNFFMYGLICAVLAFGLTFIFVSK